MKTILNTLKNDQELTLKIAAGFAGLCIAAFSLFVIVTRL